MGNFNIGNGMYKGGDTYVPDYVEYVVDKKMDKVTSQLREHKEEAELDHPDGSVTGKKLGKAAVTFDKISTAAVADNLTTNSSQKLLTAKQGYNLKNELDSHKSASNPHDIDKTMVGLPNVDNTSDVNKPVSTATQEALDQKADISDTLAGYGILDAYTKQEIQAKLNAWITEGTITNDGLDRVLNLSTGNFFELIGHTDISNAVKLEQGAENPVNLVYLYLTCGAVQFLAGENISFIDGAGNPINNWISEAPVWKQGSSYFIQFIYYGTPGSWMGLVVDSNYRHNNVSVTIAPSGGTGDYVCTGANDNLVINQALNAATANGTKAATVVFMPGSYSLAGTINVPANVTITAYQASFSNMDGSDNVINTGSSVSWSGGSFSTGEFGGGLTFGVYATVRDITNGTYGGMTVGNYSTVENCKDSSMGGLSFSSYCCITGCKSNASYAGYQSVGTDNILIGNRYDGGNNGYVLTSGSFRPADTTLFKSLNAGKLIVDNTEV